MTCKKCGKEIDKKAAICVSCGCKVKKPIYKRWWFWVLVIAVVAAVGSSSTGSGEEAADKSEDAGLNATQQDAAQKEQEIVYEAVELQTMFDELEANAMKAENKYQNKYLEFKCKISNFDSDGAYISVEPVNASEWNFTTAMCYIKNDTQKDFLLNKNVDDEITIKGKVKSVGEVLGYTLDIQEVY